MRTKLSVVALSVAVLWSASAHAAIRYTFTQTSRSEVRDIPSGQQSGTVIIDGEQSRINLDGKSVYGENAYVLALPGSRKMVIVDPAKKTVTEVNLGNVANVLAAAKITITNLHKDFKQLPDHVEIAGVPTNHYRLEASYDMTVMFGEIPLTQNVRTVIEKWTTSAFGDVNDTLPANLVQSGNPQLDDLIANETLQMKGLPVRQLVTVVTGPASGRKATVANRNLVTTRKQSTEILVSTIGIVPSDPSLFKIPDSYKRVEASGAPPEETIHNLTLGP